MTISRFFLAEVLIDEDRKPEARVELQRVIDAPISQEWAPEDQEYKAKAAALVPSMARHPQVLRALDAARGRVDPSALVLRVQGLRALCNLPRVLRLLIRGKIDPIKTFLKTRTPAAAAAARLLRRGDGR